jgi:hypothetical protein
MTMRHVVGLVLAGFLIMGLGFWLGWVAAIQRVNQAYIKGLEDAEAINQSFNQHFEPVQSDGPVKIFVPKKRD